MGNSLKVEKTKDFIQEIIDGPTPENQHYVEEETNRRLREIKIKVLYLAQTKCISNGKKSMAKIWGDLSLELKNPDKWTGRKIKLALINIGKQLDWWKFGAIIRAKHATYFGDLIDSVKKSLTKK